MLPSEIMQYLSPEQYESLCEQVFSEFKQGFGVKEITHSKSGIVVEVQLDDRTVHEVKIPN